MSNIALGTAQFGLPYGISNAHGQVGHHEIGAILSLARNETITMLDTAIAYGNSEENIGAADSTGFEIVTKLPPLSGMEESVANWVRSQTENSLAKLKRSSLYGLLLHNPADLLGAHGAELFEALSLLKQDGLIQKIGVSIYSPTELDLLIPRYMPDIVQAPLNIFDRSLEISGWLTRLSTMAVEVHTRSVFLQGLLLQKADERPTTFNKWSTKFVEFDSWVRSQQLSPLSACLGHVLSYPEVTKIIIGVTSAAELEQIITALPALPVRAPHSLQSTDVDLIQPMNWNK